jgi:hypothetical protein
MWRVEVRVKGFLESTGLIGRVPGGLNFFAMNPPIFNE